MKVLYETEGQFSSITGGVSFAAPSAIPRAQGEWSDKSSQLRRSLKHLANRDALMVKAAALVYEATAEWFDSEGEGTWPKLSQATIARKVQSAAPEPSKPLMMYGNLRASVTGPSGPHSFTLPVEDGIVIGVNWSVRGYQVADVLARGTTKRVFNPHSRKKDKWTVEAGIPARPIWPPPHSASGMWVMARIGQLFLKGV